MTTLTLAAAAAKRLLPGRGTCSLNVLGRRAVLALAGRAGELRVPEAAARAPATLARPGHAFEHRPSPGRVFCCACFIEFCSLGPGLSFFAI